jgi:hypothetical protein
MTEQDRIRRLVWAVVVLGIGALLCTEAKAQGAPKRAVTSPVRVEHSKSEMDGERWAFLTISARESYQNMFGLSIRPRLVVQCTQTGDEHKVRLRLDNVGPLENGDMRIKLDDAEAEAYSFDRLSDGSTYMYGDYENTQQLLGDFFSAKKALIEFEPFMVAGKSIAKFDLGGLRREFEKASECKFSTQPPHYAPVPPAAALQIVDQPVLAVPHYAPVPPAAAPVLPAVTGNSLAKVIERGDLGALRTRLLSGANPNEPDDSVVKGWTPLMAAAYSGNLTAARLLLDSGATLDARTEFGETALDVAARLDETEVATFLRSGAAKRSR